MARSTARIIYLVKRAEMACRAGVESCLADLGITPVQYSTLSLLASQANQSSAELARRAGVTPQSMHEIIAVLEKKTLIERAENPDHRRILTIRVTPEGERVLALCNVRVDELEAVLLAGITAEQIDELSKALYAISHNSRAV